MKINVVKDKSGKVIATFEKASGDGPSVTPELDQSMTVHEVEVADNYRQNVQAVYAQHSA
jgi:hypothetical protein